MATLHDRLAIILVASHSAEQEFEVRLHDRKQAMGVKASLEQLGCEVSMEEDGLTLQVKCGAMMADSS